MNRRRGPAADPAADPEARRLAIRQSLIGQAVGDMLGFQVERQGPAACARYARAWLQEGGRPQPLREGFAVGQVSDDTQASLAAIRALASGRGCPGIASELIAAAPGLVGAGSNTKTMLAALAGCDVGDLATAIAGRDAKVAAPAEGTNGAAMRAWPVALSHSGEEEAMAAVRMSSRITHSHPDAVAAAVAAASATRRACGGRAAWATRSIEALAPGSVERSILQLGADLADSDFGGGPKRLWKAFGADPKWKFIMPLGIPTVAWAFACAITAASPREGILRAISAGGDVDTVAGLAGSWLSVLHGSDSIADLATLANDRGRGLQAMLAEADLLCDALGEEDRP